MKKLLAVFFCFFAASCFASANKTCGMLACPDAVIGTPNFCQVFKLSARCYCKNHLPSSYCDSLTMQKLYQMLLSSTPSQNLEAACRKQTDVAYKTCIENWPYYGQFCEPLYKI